MRRRDATAALLALSGGAFGQSTKTSAAPRDLPAFQRIDKLSGSVSGTGSSTVTAVLKDVTDALRVVQPEIAVDLTGSGSSTALAGMLASPAAMGLLSREMKASERESFRAKYGYAPTELKIAVDALAVYVFKNNPAPALTIDQLRRAFGRDADAAHTWGALGLSGDWRDVPLVRYGLERGRGAFDLFRELVLDGRDFASDIQIEPVSTSVVQGVAVQRGGIGYASVYFRTVRTRAMAVLQGGQAAEPDFENALSGAYPLARFLYVIVNKPPDSGLDAAQRQFLTFVLSRDGQKVIAGQGLYPLDAKTAAQSLAKIGVVAAAAQ